MLKAICQAIVEDHKKYEDDNNTFFLFRKGLDCNRGGEDTLRPLALMAKSLLETMEKGEKVDEKLFFAPILQQYEYLLANQHEYREYDSKTYSPVYQGIKALSPYYHTVVRANTFSQKNKSEEKDSCISTDKKE